MVYFESKLSSGAYQQTWKRDQPFAERSRANVYQLVVERIVKYDIEEVMAIMGLIDARKMKSKPTVAQEYPNAELRFISWFTSDFVIAPANQ